MPSVAVSNRFHSEKGSPYWKVPQKCHTLKHDERDLVNEFNSRGNNVSIRLVICFALNILYLPPIDPSREKALRSCHAHVHRSHVVRPSDATDSSSHGGRGGGGTKRPFHRPPSLASNGSGESNESSSIAFNHHSASLARLLKALSSNESNDGNVDCSVPTVVASGPAGFGTLENMTFL